MLTSIENASSSSDAGVEAALPGIREQAATIARSGDIGDTFAFILNKPTARTVLEDELLRAGEFSMIHTLAQAGTLPVQLAQQSGVLPNPVGGPFQLSPEDQRAVQNALDATATTTLTLTLLLNTVPRPAGMQVADDVFMVFNARRYEHHFYFRGDDGVWRLAEVDGQPVYATGSEQGLLVVDIASLEQVYGGRLPDNIVNMTAIGISSLIGTGILESRARPPGVPAELQTTSPAARQALGLQPHDQMQAHHLIPANVWAAFIPQFTQARAAGWSPDGPGNLIALPATTQTQANLAAAGISLPLHNTSHNRYDHQVTAKLTAAFATLPPDATPQQVREVIEVVANGMAAEIRSGLWHPRVQ